MFFIDQPIWLDNPNLVQAKLRHSCWRCWVAWIANWISLKYVISFSHLGHFFDASIIIFEKALCLAPSRELARQIMTVIVKMGKYTSVQTEYAIRDHLPQDVKRISAQIIVGTPGTMTNLIRKKVIDVNSIKVFVLDEADNMLDQDGLGDQTLRIKKCVLSSLLVHLLPFNPCIACPCNTRSFLPRSANLQIILFSATFPDLVRRFASKFAPNANKIELQQNELSVEGIRQFYMDCKNEEHKYDILVSLYSLLTIGQSIIFCRVSGHWFLKSPVCQYIDEFSIDTRRIGFQSVWRMRGIKLHHCTERRTL